MDDRELVSALRSGDVRGLAGVYDRYADRLVAYAVTMLRDPDAGADAVHDALLVARERIGQLRDPDRLRPWLYAIVRTECLHRLRDQRRVAPLEAAGEVIDPTADDPGRDARAGELRELVWAAAAALNPGEREVLELSVRHGLKGAELAAALGVTVNTAHAQSSRARAQLERSLGALLVARTGGRECPELAALLTGWDGTLTPLLRKRLARHADRCEVCGETRRTRLSPVALLAGVPFLPAPAGLRDRILRTAATTDPGSPDTGTAAQDAGREARRAAGQDAGRAAGSAVGEAAGRAGRYGADWRWAADGFPYALDRHRSGTWRWSAAAVAVLAALLTAGLLLRPGSAPLTAADQILPPPVETTATPAPTTAPAPTTTAATTTTTTTTKPTTAAPTTAPALTTAAPPVPSPTLTTVPAPPPATTTAPAPPPPTTTAATPPPPPPPPPPAPAVTTRWSLAAPACPASWRARLTATVTGTTATSVLAGVSGGRGVPTTAAMTAAGRGTWTVLVSLPADADLTWTATASTADGRIRSAAGPLRHDCVR